MSFKQNFTKNFNFLLEKNNVSKTFLAKNIGVSQQAISKISAGESFPSIEKLIAIADYFNTSLDILMGRKILYREPEGFLPYLFKSKDRILEGTFHYVFGIIPDKDNYRFLLIEDKEGSFIYEAANLKSLHLDEFNAFIDFLNSSLNLNYVPLPHNGIDIVVKVKNEYFELYCEYPSAIGIELLSATYPDRYIEYWLSLPLATKVTILQSSLEIKKEV